MDKARRLVGPAALILVVLCALIVGSGALSSDPPSDAQRVSHLESIVKCPSCEDLSVAQSTAPSALAVRNQIKVLVDEGKSDGQITDALVSQYGPTVLLSPPASGATLVLWLLPVLVFVGAIIGVVVVVVSRRRALDLGATP